MVGARTQPLLSCIMMAKMKRGSMPVDAPTDWMAVEISLISASVLSATPNWVQLADITALLLLNLRSNVRWISERRFLRTYMVVKSETHWLCAGQPSATVPVPP